MLVCVAGNTGYNPAVHPLQWIYSEDQLWDALSFQNATITLAAHIQLAKGGRWFAGAPPTITGEVSIKGQVGRARRSRHSMAGPYGKEFCGGCGGPAHRHGGSQHDPLPTTCNMNVQGAQTAR